jgi:hypothetical protein
MVKIVVSIESGKVLYSTFDEVDLQQGEIIVEEPINTYLLNPYYNFDTKEFYEGATAEQIAEYQNEILQQKKEIANELLKETDWYVIRFQETGKPIPQDILDLRKQIRDNA